MGRILTLYKLTTANDMTGLNYTPLQWGPGVDHRASGEGALCGPGWIHAYEHPLLSVLHNPIHGNFDLDFAHLWECETEDDNPLKDGQLKLGVRHLRTVKQIEVPMVTRTQCVRYGILCAKAVCTNPDWNSWADNWLSGQDRSEGSAARAAWAAQAAARAEAANGYVDLIEIAMEAVNDNAQ